MFFSLVRLVQRTPWFDTFVSPYTWEIRIKLRTKQFLKVARQVCPKRANADEISKNEIREVLFLDNFPGYGDALYINGLLKVLRGNGINVHIATCPKLKTIYQTAVSTDAIYDITSEEDVERIAKRDWDCAVNLSFFVERGWEKRLRILKNLKCRILDSDPLVAKDKSLNFEYLDVSSVSHIGDRWATVVKSLTGKSVARVSPYVGLKPVESKENYVYINTVGSRWSRTISQEQIGWIEEFLNTNKLIGYFYCKKENEIRVSEYVRRIDPESFVAACRLIAGARGVITPDTSVVHVASAYSIPQLALFAGNCIAQYINRPMEDVFGPIGEFEILKPTRKEYFSKQVVPVSAVTKEELCAALSRFLEKVNCSKEKT